MVHISEAEPTRPITASPDWQAKAAAVMQPWMSVYANNDAEFTTDKFIEQLRRAFQDPEL